MHEIQMHKLSLTSLYVLPILETDYILNACIYLCAKAVEISTL